MATRSCLAAFGGKFRLIRKEHIDEFLPPFATTKDIYVEMFGYGMNLFFNLNPTPKFAILNNKNDDIMNFWRQVRDHRAELEHELEYCWIAPSCIQEYAQRDDAIGKAVHYYLRNVISWSGNSKRIRYIIQGGSRERSNQKFYALERENGQMQVP